MEPRVVVAHSLKKFAYSGSLKQTKVSLHVNNNACTSKARRSQLSKEFPDKGYVKSP